MPVEIREIQISMSPHDEGPSPAVVDPSKPGMTDDERRALIAECVQAVLQALRDRAED